jgi:DNA repair exonuclease SbcCD ATPase subunit
MKLFENEKLTKVNERIKELEDKKAAVQGEMNEILEAVEKTIESYAIGDVDEQDVEKAKELLEVKTNEINEIDELIQRVKAVRKSVALESVPFVKEARAKKVIEARNAFLRELAELGRVAKEVGSVNAEFNNVMRELGEQPARFGAAINEKTIISGGWTREEDCLGVEENLQKQVYKSGVIPKLFGGAN